MSSPEIKISVTASTAAASAQLDEFGERTKRAMDAYNAAAARGKSVSDALGKAFDQAMSAGKSFTEAMEQATASVNTYAGAAQRAAGATRNVTSTFYAAQGASGLLEGRIPIRAMERFIASSELASSVLRNAFPYIGLAAVGEVLFRAAEGAYNLYEKFLDIGAADKQLLEAFRKMQDTDLLNVHSIETARERLDQVNESASALRETAQQLHGVFVRNFWGDLISGNVQNAALDVGLMGDTAKAMADLSTKNREESIQLGLKQLEIEHQMNTLKIEAAHAADGALQGEAKINAQLQEQLALHKENAIFEKQRERSLGNSAPGNAGSEQQALEDQIARGRAAAELANLKEKKPKETLEVKIEVSESIEEAREKIRQLQEDARSGEEQMTATFDAHQKDLQRGVEEELKAQRAALETYKEKARLLQQLASEQDAEARGAKNIADAQIAAAEATGHLTRAGADQEKAAADADYYRDRIVALRAELAQLVPMTEEYERVQKELNQVQAQAQVAQIQSNTRTAQDIAAPYIKATDSINDAWLQMQNKLIFGTKNVSVAFANMGVSMLESVAASFEKMLVKQLQFNLQSAIANQAKNTLQNAQDAAASAQHEALTRTTGLKEIFVDAKVAAADAFKWASGWGGPVAGAVAAGVTFPAVMALGAFETGGITTKTGLYVTHEGEATLPRNLTQMLTSVANDNHSSSITRNSTVNSHNHFHGITDRNFRDMLRRHSDMVAESVHRAIRSGAKVTT